MDSAAADLGTVVAPSVAKPLRLLPFRGVMLAESRVGDPASARALSRPYREVADRLIEWIARGWARRDETPALYLHEYTSGGLAVRGVVGRLDIAAQATSLTDRAVLPHERVHPEQVEELAHRMHEMGLNPAPILLVHSGVPSVRTLLDTIAERSPDHAYLDRAAQHHRIWAIRDGEELDRLQGGLEEATCLLADGHHRYAAYLRLHARDGDGPWASGLAMVFDQADTPLFLGPIHRTVRRCTFTTMTRAAIERGATVRACPRHEALIGLDARTLVMTDGATWATVSPDLEPGQTPVEWLHARLLPAAGVDPLLVGFHHSVDDALGRAAKNRVALLMPAPDFASVQKTIEAGRLLPEKATSFQPKPSLGALMRPVDDG